MAKVAFPDVQIRAITHRIYGGVEELNSPIGSYLVGPGWRRVSGTVTLKPGTPEEDVALNRFMLELGGDDNEVALPWYHYEGNAGMFPQGTTFSGTTLTGAALTFSYTLPSSTTDADIDVTFARGMMIVNNFPVHCTFADAPKAGDAACTVAPPPPTRDPVTVAEFINVRMQASGVPLQQEGSPKRGLTPVTIPWKSI